MGFWPKRPSPQQVILSSRRHIHGPPAALFPTSNRTACQADRLVGGSDAVLVIDDTTIPKKGTHSVGVYEAPVTFINVTNGQGSTELWAKVGDGMKQRRVADVLPCPLMSLAVPNSS